MSRACDSRANRRDDLGSLPKRPDDSRSGGRAVVREHAITAARVELRHHGPSSVSIRAVARRADIPVSSLYRHFTDRADLLNTVAAYAYRDLTDEIECSLSHPRNKEDAEDLFRAFARALRGWAISNFAEFALLYGPDALEGGQWPEPVRRERARAASLVGQVVARIGDGGHETDASIQNSPSTPWTDEGGATLSPGAMAMTMSVWAALVGHLALAPRRSDIVAIERLHYQQHVERVLRMLAPVNVG